MARSRSSSSNGTNGSTANLGFEAKLWLAADKLRSNMDAAVPSEATSEPKAKAYKHARIYDPACGSGGMFVQSEKFVESHGGKLGDISIYGQESNATTRRLAVINLTLRGIEADFGPEHADTFHRDLHPNLCADHVYASPRFHASKWWKFRDLFDKRFGK